MSPSADRGSPRPEESIGHVGLHALELSPGQRKYDRVQIPDSPTPAAVEPYPPKIVKPVVLPPSLRSARSNSIVQLVIAGSVLWDRKANGAEVPSLGPPVALTYSRWPRFGVVGVGVTALVVAAGPLYPLVLVA